jgi:hypothetical protein
MNKVDSLNAMRKETTEKKYMGQHMKMVPQE